MSNATSIQMKHDTVTARLEGIVSRGKSLRGYLNRVVYRQYQEAQIERWNTENASEGSPWKPLNKTYEARKQIKYASFPYGGKRMLVATGSLLKSVVGSERKFHRKIVDNNALTVMTTLEYAPYVAKVRPFMKFSKQTKKRIIDGMKQYLYYRRTP